MNLELADVHATITRLPGHDDHQQAAAHYQRIRAHDQRLHTVAAQAAELVRGWTGYPSALLGSFSLGLNVDTSDLDLGLVVHAHPLGRVAGSLDTQATFKGERRSTPTSPRLVFGTSVAGSASTSGCCHPPTTRPCWPLEPGAASRCPHLDKPRHVWRKHLLRQAGHHHAYEVFKLRRYCPEFTWTPVL